MAVGLPYLAAKAVEYSATLDWVIGQLSSIPTLPSNHPHTQQHLNQRIAAARRRVLQLKTIVLLNQPALLARGISIVNELQFDVYILSEAYLPALNKEAESEAEFGRLAKKAAWRCGLTDVQEIIINLSGGHAVLPAMLTCPLMFAPPHQRHTLIDLTAIYHEFGHIVFQGRPEIRDGLSRVISDYFRALERAGGFMSPSEREERKKQINQAIAYWNSRRLAEIFCDIFATYTTGPAYYYSCVDMAIRCQDDPYKIDITDEHPPMAARVLVCRNALRSNQLDSEIGQESSALWHEHVRSKTARGDYRLWCADKLLENTVKVCNDFLARSGVFRRYNGSGHHPQLVPTPDINLEDVLNESVRTLLRSPDAYVAWEKPFIDAMFA